MSNHEKIYRKWDMFVEEAAIPDYVLEVGDGSDPLVFTTPTGVALMRISSGIRHGDMEAILMGIAGDQWDRLRALFATAGHEAMGALMEDLMDHFKLYDEVVLEDRAGGRTTRRRPSEIRTMLKNGWAVVGEASSRR